MYRNSNTTSVATFYQERINEFLNVAKNLEIKEISKDVEFDHGNELTEETDISDNDSDQVIEPQQTDTNLIENEISVKNTDIISKSQLQKNTEGIFKCNQCDSKYTFKRGLRRHIKSTHEGVKYFCNQCDMQFTRNDHLNTHIQTMHEGVKYKYACNKCEYQATQQWNLKIHIQSKHDGVRYNCSECEYQATLQGSVARHMKTKH